MLINSLNLHSFVDRDMLMRYHWGHGIGHVYSHPQADVIAGNGESQGQLDGMEEAMHGLVDLDAYEDLDRSSLQDIRVLPSCQDIPPLTQAEHDDHGVELMLEDREGEDFWDDDSSMCSSSSQSEDYVDDETFAAFHLN